MLEGSIYWRSEEEKRNLFVSIATSLAIHALGLLTWLLTAAAILALARQQTEQALIAEAARQQAQPQEPIIFVEISPEQVTEEPPKDTPYYSIANTQAANPEPANTDTPKIDGSQTQIVKTFDVLQPEPAITTPAPPPEVAEPIEPLPKPQIPTPTENTPSDLAVETPAETKPDTTPAPHPPREKPRTLVEARLRQGIQVAPQMQQDGGTPRRGVIAVDTKASPFGAYDAALIAAVQKRWYDLLDSSAVAPKPGRVVVMFTLHYDGRITDARVAEEDVGEIRSLYCSKAITDPAPYAPWPDEMRTLIGKDHREVRFAFVYF
jgi:outer membrane biosynthesis protein TonB